MNNQNIVPTGKAKEISESLSGALQYKVQLLAVR